MKRKETMINIRSLAIASLLLCAVFSAKAAYIPISIPIYHSYGSGSASPKSIIGLWIALNILSLLIILIRSLIWLIKKPKYTLFEFAIYSDCELITPFINTVFFIGLNVIALVFTLTIWITSIL